MGKVRPLLIRPSQTALYGLGCFEDERAIRFNRSFIKAGSNAGYTQRANNFISWASYNCCYSSNVRVSFTHANVSSLFTNLCSKFATPIEECFQYLARSAKSHRNYIASFYLVSSKVLGVYSIKANTELTARDVKRGTLTRCLHQRFQNRFYDYFQIQVLSEKGAQSPQHRAEVVQPLRIFNHVAKLFQRYSKTKNCGFCQSATVGELFQRKGCTAIVESIQECKSAFNGIYAGKSIILSPFIRKGLQFCFQFTQPLRIWLQNIIQELQFTTSQEIAK